MRQYFMSETSYAALEKSMQETPGFRPRRSGLQVRREAPVDLYGKSYESIVDLVITELQIQELRKRLEKIYREGRRNFRDQGHEKRFREVCNGNRGEAVSTSSSYASAVFLLTADAFLWERACSFTERERICFDHMKIGGVDLDGYTIFHTARDLYQGTQHVKVSELSDPELIDDALLHLLFQAFLIRGYGVGMLSLS